MADLVTNSKLYELIDRTRMELKSDNIRVEQKLDVLESTRLARLEKQVNELQVQLATAGTKLAVLAFISSAIVGAIISAIALRVVR